MSRAIFNKHVKKIKAIDLFVDTYLTKEDIKELNDLALWEFFKPVKHRFSPIEVLNKITDRKLKENDKTIASFG